jgi:hypothetical protein
MATPVLVVQDVEGNNRVAVSTDAITATFADLRVASQTGLTALAGGAQAGTPLKPGFNQFSVVASGSDSAQLPVALPGMLVIVSTIAATNALAVFAQTGDTINAIAANSAFSLATVKVAIFICAVAGKWYTILTA